MAITDIFKKEGKDVAKGKAVAKAKTAAVSDKKPTHQDADKAQRAATAKRIGLDRVAGVIKHAHVTEKATLLGERNQYVFDVAKNAGKKEIKRAIESYYSVQVTGVNSINIPPRTKRRGKGIAVTPGYRKAIVSVKAGQKIDILPR